MKNLFNAIGKKIYAIVGLLVFSTVVVLIVGIVALDAIDALLALRGAERDHTVHFYQGVNSFEKFIRNEDESLIGDLDAHLKVSLGESRQFGSLLDDVRRQSITAAAEELDAAFPTMNARQARNLVILAALFSDNPILKDLVETAQAAHAAAAEYRSLAEAYRSAEAPAEKTALLSRMDEINGTVDNLSGGFSEGVQRLSAWALSLIKKVLIGVFLLFSAVALLVSTKTIRAITGQLRSAVGFSEKVASGDFSGQLAAGSQDETGQLVRAINRICVEVGGSIRKIGDTARQVSQDAVSQSASTRQTAAALDQISTTTKETAGHSKAAEKLTLEAVEIVKGADDLMASLVQSMARISENSAAAETILKNIDEIAFQTNLLSLNAAVEAARAGEAGQGFSVVAREVNNLAGRATQAAQTTQELIEGMTEKIDEGSRAVEKTADRFNRLTETINTIHDLIRKIAAISDDQARGVEGVDQAVKEINRVVALNAKNAQALTSDIELFKTHGDGDGGNRRLHRKATERTPARKALPR